MKVKTKFTLCVLTLFLINQLAIAQIKSKDEKKLNVLFFLVDDLGWKDLGYAGTDFYETPNIDALAKDSRIFKNAYAACPVCSPTRASIMSGKLPARTGITDWIGAKQQNEWDRNTQMLPANYVDRLALEETTLAEALKDAGYSTFFAGKWHLGPEGYWPEDQGFDINKAGVDKGSPGKGGYFSPYNNSRLKDGPEGEYLPERLTNETVTYIKGRKNKEQPFFIYHSFYLVHTPLLAKDSLIAKYKRKKDSLGIKDTYNTIGKDVYDLSKVRKVRSNHSNPVYAAMVEALDQSVGKIIKSLKEEGLYENTLIVFTSDNGGLSTSEGSPTSNLPLKAGKGWAYEGGIREPLIIRWPGITHPGSESLSKTISTDFYPTILEVVGLPLRTEQHIDGISLVPVLKNEKEIPRTLYWHYPHYGNQGGSPFSAIMEDDYKLIKYYENGGYYELYNLKTDEYEENNIISKEPNITKALKIKLSAFLKETNAKFPVKNPDFKAGI